MLYTLLDYLKIFKFLFLKFNQKYSYLLILPLFFTVGFYYIEVNSITNQTPLEKVFNILKELSKITVPSLFIVLTLVRTLHNTNLGDFPDTDILFNEKKITRASFLSLAVAYLFAINILFLLLSEVFDRSSISLNIDQIKFFYCCISFLIFHYCSISYLIFFYLFDKFDSFPKNHTKDKGKRK